jgi:anti-sigma factor RsiW
MILEKHDFGEARSWRSNDMDNLEKQLAKALRPQDPPADFTAKVMARVLKGKVDKKSRLHWWEFFLLPAQRAALAGGLAVLMLAAGSGVAYQQHQASERRRAEAARDQLLLALRVTGTQLNRVSRVLSTAAQDQAEEKQ